MKALSTEGPEERTGSRLSANLIPIEDKDAKRSRDFEPSTCTTRMEFESMKDTPENLTDFLKVELLCRAKDTSKEDYEPIGHIACYDDGSWSYIHLGEGIRRGLFTSTRGVIRRLVWAVYSGHDAPPAEERRRETGPYGHTRRRQTHPSFGMARFSRVSCGGAGEHAEGARLYGSQVQHGTVIRLEIMRGEVDRDLSHDWYHSGSSIVEVDMSTAQFASLVGTMNHGSGIPCTISNVLGRVMPDLPPLPDLPALAQEDFGEYITGMTERLNDLERKLQGASKKLGKGRTEDFLMDLKCAREALTGGVPYLQKQFIKSVEHTVAEAKTEIDATTSLFSQRVGEAVLDGRLPTALAEEIAPKAPDLPGSPKELCSCDPTPDGRDPKCPTHGDGLSGGFPDGRQALLDELLGEDEENSSIGQDPYLEGILREDKD